MDTIKYAEFINNMKKVLKEAISINKELNILLGHLVNELNHYDYNSLINDKDFVKITNTIKSFIFHNEIR